MMLFLVACLIFMLFFLLSIVATALLFVFVAFCRWMFVVVACVFTIVVD